MAEYDGNASLPAAAGKLDFDVFTYPGNEGTVPPVRARRLARLFNDPAAAEEGINPVSVSLQFGAARGM